MADADIETPWDDPAWREKGDGPWRARLRRHQAWWRATQLKKPAGPRVGGERLVASMLPHDVGLSPNLMTQQAVRSAGEAIAALKKERRPGLILEERLRRNLLSSQPLCFNIFGHLSASPGALLPWVRSLAPGQVAEVRSIRLEWAPSAGNVGGSAFDAFVEYSREDGGLGLLGVECKYAEKLTETLRKPAAQKWKDATNDEDWLPSAVDVLDRTGLRQLWFNQVLTQLVARERYAEAVGVVTALAADNGGRDAVNAVRGQLRRPESFQFSSLEDVVSTVEGHDDWRSAFTQRYLDLTPTDPGASRP